MSKYGILVASQYRQDLPEFPDQSTAEEALLAWRDRGLQDLGTVRGLAPLMDYSPASLKLLERWYFENGEPVAATSGYSIAQVVALYFGEVLCRSQQFQWVVQEYAFAEGRYQIGVERPLFAIMLTKGMRLQLAGNKRMQSLWRQYQRYTS
jgi:hypothetical protein